jgi:hypothetical protein
MQIDNCKMKNAELKFFGFLNGLFISGFAKSPLCSLYLCGYFFLAADAICAAPQEVVLVQGEAFLGELVSVEADGVVAFRRGTPGRPAAEAASPGVERVKLGEIVRWGNPVAARAQTIVVLADGGQLVTAADWAGGVAVRLDGNDVVVLSDTLGEVRLPRAAVSGVVFAQRRNAEDRAKLVEAVRAGPALVGGEHGTREDALLLVNGDRLTGKLAELGRGSLTIETAGGAAKLPLSRVEAVELGHSGQLSVVRGSLQIVVGLRDGSLVYADEVAASDKELEIRAAAAWEAKGGSVTDVVALQSLGGPIVYLSDLEAASYRHVPYLDVEWPYERDRNVTGGPLVVGGKRFLKGIGMHSAARLTYRLDKKYARFDAAVAVDDAAEGRGSVTFGVYLRRHGKLSEAYKSEIVRGGEAPRAVSVDVRGADALTLVVDYADRGDEMDRAEWLDARLTKE